MNAHDILIKPVVSEKSTDLLQDNKYTFLVPIKVNKIQVRQAVEQIFKVKVQAVNTIRMQGKVKRMGKHVGKRSDYKKAIVTLAPGNQIEIFEGA